MEVISFADKITNEQTKLIKDFKDCLPKKVEIKKYWNSHGTKVDWGTDVFENVESMKLTEHSYDVYGLHVVIWTLEINGEEYNGDIESYDILKTKIKLTSCVGAG